MENINESQSASVEKINLSELKAEQAKIKFEEKADTIINDPMLQKNAFQYLKQHPDEYKEIFGEDLKIIE